MPKYITNLQRDWFNSKPRQLNGKWVYTDQGTSLVELHTPIKEPFHQDLAIMLSQNRANSKRSRYPSKLILKIFLPDIGDLEVKMERKIVKGKYASTPYYDQEQRLLKFFAFPQERLFWVNYLFWEK